MPVLTSAMLTNTLLQGHKIIKRNKESKQSTEAKDRNKVPMAGRKLKAMDSAGVLHYCNCVLVELAKNHESAAGLEPTVLWGYIGGKNVLQICLQNT